MWGTGAGSFGTNRSFFEKRRKNRLTKVGSGLCLHSSKVGIREETGKADMLGCAPGEQGYGEATQEKKISLEELMVSSLAMTDALASC